MMTTIDSLKELDYQQRLNALRESKIRQTQEKQELCGCLDADDLANILPPMEVREVVQTISPSGVPITDVRMKGVHIKATHPNGEFYGPRACGENFRALMDAYPIYVDPMSSMAGAIMVGLYSYRKGGWMPELDYSHLHEEQEKYGLITGIGASQHFCQDMAIGIELGWDGILKKVRRWRKVNAPHGSDFYDGCESVVLGVQGWIQRHVEEGYHLAEQTENSVLRENLKTMSEINVRLVTDPPNTFREVCQWISWFQMAGRIYNGAGALGRLDQFLWPFYQKEKEAGTLSDDEAIFHIACMLIKETGYIQLGGPAKYGNDATNRVSYLILEAAHRLKIPVNIAVCVGKDLDPGLLQRGVEILFEDKAGIPKFIGSNSVVQGFARNGYPLELARQRAYSGCHWHALPGREYTLNDCVKINFGCVFDVALREMMADNSLEPSIHALWQCFEKHLRRSIEVIAEGIDFHLKHYAKVYPELILDLLCHQTIERGLDASEGGVEYYNLCVDGSALATVADSFAALEQRIEQESRLSWQDLMSYLDSDWGGLTGERMRLMMRNIHRYGRGGSRADDWALQISQVFTRLVKEKPTPDGHNLIPGLFSWANTIGMGKTLGATPNGRHAGTPISHGASPDPGFRPDGAPTAMAVAVASVQCGYGNASPMQIDMDPGLSKNEGGVNKIASLIRTHFELGGTQININVMDAEKVLEAHKDPSKYPDLIVRATGFSAYFCRLSEEFRQLIVNRIIAGV